MLIAYAVTDELQAPLGAPAADLLNRLRQPRAVAAQCDEPAARVSFLRLTPCAAKRRPWMLSAPQRSPWCRLSGCSAWQPCRCRRCRCHQKSPPARPAAALAAAPRVRRPLAAAAATRLPAWQPGAPQRPRSLHASAEASSQHGLGNVCARASHALLCVCHMQQQHAHQPLTCGRLHQEGVGVNGCSSRCRRKGTTSSSSSSGGGAASVVQPGAGTRLPPCARAPPSGPHPTAPSGACPVC